MLGPVYFRPRIIPSYAKFEVDLLTEDKDFDSEEVSQLTETFPNYVVIPDSRKEGAKLPNNCDFITIFLSDPNALLEVNDILIHAGAGMLTLPTGCLANKASYKIYHTGPVTVERRFIYRDLATAFRAVKINIFVSTLNCVLEDGQMRFDKVASNSTGLKTHVKLLKDYGILYDSP